MQLTGNTDTLYFDIGEDRKRKALKLARYGNNLGGCLEATRDREGLGMTVGSRVSCGSAHSIYCTAPCLVALRL